MERVSGTPQHAEVKRFIVNKMRNFGWDVEQNEFSDRTPIDKFDRKFTNIIARLNPNAERYLVLACHYDSKYMKGFVGATDSAVPCAIMMNIAHTLKPYFETRKNTDLSLMFIFFDGEEAFKNWNSHDSIYGARHLAKKWHENDKLKHIVSPYFFPSIGSISHEKFIVESFFSLFLGCVSATRFAWCSKSEVL